MKPRLSSGKCLLRKHLSEPCFGRQGANVQLSMAVQEIIDGLELREHSLPDTRSFQPKTLHLGVCRVIKPPEVFDIRSHPVQIAPGVFPVSADRVDRRAPVIVLGPRRRSYLASDLARVKRETLRVLCSVCRLN